MKKKILSIALALCMIFAVLPTEVFADGTTVQGSGTESDPWILTQDSILNYIGFVVNVEYFKLSSGYYKLGENMDIEIALYVSDYSSVTLDLNGCELNRRSNDKAVCIPGGTELTIKDSKSGGKIMGYGSGIYMFGGASLKLDGGTVNTIATTEKNHTITINDGTVTDGIFGGYGWAGGKPYGTVLIANGGTVNGHVTCKEIKKDEGCTGTDFNASVDVLTIADNSGFCKADFMKDDNNKHVTKVVSSGNKITAPTVPTKDGHEFLGWYTATTGGTKFDFNTAITADITLYARFTPNTYTVSYNAGANGTGTVAAGTKTYGVDFTLSSETFTRTGYTQTGWATTDGGEKVYDLGDSYTDNVAVTLYPVWTVNQYTITVKPENGNNDITITQDYDTIVTAPTLTRDGYAFDGWDKTFPTTMPAGSMTITAKWKDITTPTGEITLDTNRWDKFLNSITFGLFFKDTQEITITATDNSGEEVTVEYLLSDKELSETELANKTFTEYTGNFNIEPNNEYVIYAKLTDKAGNVTYINSNGIVLDNVKPIISGITNGKTYCAAQTVTVSDKYEVTVTVNGKPVTLDTNRQFTLSPAEVEQEIVVTDKAGNQTEMTVTVNDGHTYEWQSENGKYWQKCKFCDHETTKKDIPEITINGVDKVCVTQDYTFTFTLPEGVTDPKAAYYPSENEQFLSFAENNGVYTATVSHTEYLANSTVVDFFVKAFAKTADGFEFQVSKEVRFQQEHTGGTADCTHKAKCEVCGEEYGEINTANHTTLKHIEAKAATTEAEGNNEYWHCEECGKYFSDKDGKNEIKLADTVIAKLTKTDSEEKSPQTGDNSHMVLWFALLLVSGGTFAGITVYGKKKKRFVK